MAVILEDKDRVIIPRWRDFWTTLMLGELAPSSSPILVSSTAKANVAEQIDDWKSYRTLSFAADLVGSALVVGASGTDVEEAAEFILSNSGGSPRLAKELAAQVLAPGVRTKLLPPQELPDTDLTKLKQQSGQQLRQLRQRLWDEPRNSILLADMARHYTVLGLKKKAEHAMRVALKFGSENRFILRSAARLYAHQGDPEQGHFLLRRARSTRNDPWLLSAEIALASASSKKSLNVKKAFQVLEDKNYSSFETAELASAVATLEMINSNNKTARKLFRRALIAPTENTVAQAEWASRHMLANFEVEINSIPPRNYEARSWELFLGEEWDGAFEQSMKWLYDQPFLVSPVLFSGFLASTVFEDYELSARILQFGLLANPGDNTVLNNLAFALASGNRTDEARIVFNQIDRSALDEGWKIIVTATEGLLRFREGFEGEGRALYSRSMEAAGSRYRQLRTRAAIYLAREELLANSPKANEAVMVALRESPPQDDKTSIVLLQRLQDLQERGN